MMHLKQFFRPLIILMACGVLAVSCSHYISPYDQFAYAQTTAVKVDVLNMMDKSNESYTSHQQEVEKVTGDLMKVIEYEKHRINNGITVRMWGRMLDSTGQNGIVGRYFASWKKNGTKLPDMISESKQQVSQGFDLIADLESQKIKESDATVLNFLK